jgi:protein O-mannosyl-transferase
MDSMTGRADARLPRGVIVGLLAVAALIPFVMTLSFGYVLDDTDIIQRNPDLAGGWRSILEVWKQPYGGHLTPDPGLYRPLTMSVFALVWTAGGHSAFWFHLIVVVMHMAATALVWRLLARCLDQWTAILAAIWFAVHPVHVEVVANISNSSEVLVALWTCVLALYLARIAQRESRVSWMQATVAGGLFLGAFFAKESGAVAPLLAAVYAWGWRGWRRHETATGPTRLRAALLRWWPILAAWVAAAAIVFATRWLILGNPIVKTSIAAPGLAELSAGQRVLAMLALGPKVFRLLIWPGTHNPYYGPSTFVEPRALWAVVTILALALALSLAARRAKNGDLRWLAAIVWTLVAFVPASNLFVPTGQILGERTLYVPSIGMAMLVGLVIEAAASRAIAFRNPRLIRGAGLTVIAMMIASFALRTALFANRWRSHKMLFAQMIHADSASYKGYWMSGLDARYEGRLREATILFAKAYELYPTDRSVIMDYSMALSARGDVVRAASVAAKLVESPQNRRDMRAVAFYLAAVSRAFGPESLQVAARRFAR